MINRRMRSSATVRSLAGLAIVCAGLATALATVEVTPVDAQETVLAEPIARPGVASIVEAFQDYHLVAIGEEHRNQQLHDFLVTLLRDPHFLPRGGDIVVEFGNARYQKEMDRYIIGGELLAPRELAHVWRDAMNILVWDAPVYARFFATVRAVNLRRPPASRLRVLLGDPPIDWGMIHDRATWERIAETRDQHAAEVIDREVLARGHRALLIFGSGHVDKEKAFDAYGKPNRIRLPNLAELLEERHPGATLLVWSHTAGWKTSQLDSRLIGWLPPAMARLKGTWLGDAHVGPPSDTPRLEDLADVFLYLGPTASLTYSTPSQEIYRNTVYLRELLRRNVIQGGANTEELRRLRTKYLDGKRE